MNDGMKDANVAEALYCPVEVVASLVKDPSEARAILEIAMLGRQIQELLNLQSLHRNYDISDLQKVSNLILSSSDTRLSSSGAADMLMKSANALKRSIEAISGSISSCFAAIEKLSHSIKQHAEKNGAIAAELQRKPRCQELSIERYLLSRIQEELAKRGEAIACSRGVACVPPGNRPFAAMVDILKSSAAAELEVLAASARSGHQTEPITTLTEHHETVAALREEMQVLKRGMQAMANQFHQFQQHSTFQQHLLGRPNYLMATRAQIIPIEEKKTPESEARGDGEAKPTSRQQDDQFPSAQPYVNLRTRESPFLEFKENLDVEHTRDRVLRGDAAPSTTSSQPRQSSPLNHLSTKQMKLKSLSKSVKSNEKEASIPDFCFPTKDPFGPAVLSGFCGDGRTLNHEDYCDEEEKEIDATQSLEDQYDVDKQEDKEEEEEVPKTQRTVSEHEHHAGRKVARDQADDQRGEWATPSVLQRQQGANSDAVIRTAVGMARDPRSLPTSVPLRPIKGWWSSQKDSTSPGSGENHAGSGENHDDCVMPEAKRVRRESEESPDAIRPTHQPFHRQGTQQSGGVFTPATYAMKLSQKSLAGPTFSAPPSSVRVAGAAKGATPMFVSLDPTMDRTEHGITPPPPCGTGVSIYKRDMT